VPGTLPSREQDGPLSLPARLGLYAMLTALVVASFTVTPARVAPVSATTTIENEPAAARIAPMSRGLARVLRDVDNLELEVSPLPTPEASAAPAIEVVPVPLREVTVEAEPEATATPEPEPETTPAPTRAPTPRPTPTPVPVAGVTSATLAAEIHMLELINASRARGGLVALAMDVVVTNTARAHSTAEAQVRYVYHDGPDGTAQSRNVPACGTGWYGENTGKIWNNNVDALHIEFMNEPWEPINHRTNIMDPNFRRIGVGAVIGPDAMYMTMVFCR
jgi:uncharacterized protein YkwD